MSYIELPNDSQLWVKGIALDWYTTGYDKEKLEYIKSDLGQSVREYKYFSQLNQKRREAIVRKCSDSISKVLRLEEELEKPNFNACIGVAPNRKTGHSLPLDLALQLSIRFDWLKDESNCLVKTRDMDTIKKLKGEKLRAGALQGGYKVNESFDYSGIRGFLIIDDVFETGATLKEVCRTLQSRFPAIPRYVLTITQVKPVEVWKSEK
jgi:predicted amidophosphoribosyltransferase